MPPICSLFHLPLVCSQHVGDRTETCMLVCGLSSVHFVAFNAEKQAIAQCKRARHIDPTIMGSMVHPIAFDFLKRSKKWTTLILRHCR
jgi:hypothetical protein